MTAVQPTLAAHPHRNQRLFSDHYLNSVVPNLGEWRIGAGEAQTEEDLIKPVLRVLGHAFEVQPSLQITGGPAKVPDYILYRDLAALNANKGKLLTDEDLKHALAVSDARDASAGVWQLGNGSQRAVGWHGQRFPEELSRIRLDGRGDLRERNRDDLDGLSTAEIERQVLCGCAPIVGRYRASLLPAYGAAG